MAKRLFINLTLCDGCKECTADCVYFYRRAVKDTGVVNVRELATFTLVCRRCEEPCCVASCRFQALERNADGILERHNMRCVSCKCCAHACPFGTIYPELVPFYSTRCDYCVGQADGIPSCAKRCDKHALEYRDVEESAKDGIFCVGDHLAVRAPKWDKKDV